MSPHAAAACAPDCSPPSLARPNPPNHLAPLPARLHPPPSRQVKKADQLNAIALVMATHNKGRVAEFFLGSCTSYVTHHAHRPVVVVPPATKAA
jgi:hypothetical protein